MSVVRSADARRGDHFKGYLRGGAAAAVYFGIAPLAFVAGTASRGVLVGAVAGVGALLLFAAGAFWVADRRAESDFFHQLADTLGYRYLFTTELPPLSPLLGAGDRRRVEHAMEGTLKVEGAELSCVFGHYTYEVRETDDDGDERWRPFRFTVCVSEVAQAFPRFRGVYLRRRRGLLDRLDHDWLRGRAEQVSLESTAFNEAYELRAVDDQDRVELRRLFAPTLVRWLSEHPLKPGFELRVGTLVTFVPGHLEDLGRITWLMDASRHLAHRLTRESGEDLHRPAA
jgi:hypothetical protein